jgi:hypothetical protein
MRIELTKNIKVKSIEVVAEIDFYKESPYVEMLSCFHHQIDLEKELLFKNVSEAAIHNIIKNLEILGVIKNGSIVNLNNGFPEKELGKYKITYYENDTIKPFKFYIKYIERVQAVSKNIADNIVDIDKQLLKVLNQTDNKDFETNETFKVISVIDGKVLYLSNQTSENFTIVYENEKWSYKLSNQPFETMDSGIELNELFKGAWINNEELLEKTYTDVTENEKAIKQFLLDYKERQNLREYGNFNIQYSNIPIAPNRNSQKKWFLHLLKDEIISHKQYVTIDDLEQIWNNLYYQTNQINRCGDLPFNYEQIINEFNKNTEVYWLLQAGKDLNPFQSKYIKTNPVITIKAENNADLELIFNHNLSLDNVNNLVIIDRYINTKRHFEALAILLAHYENLNIKIFSQASKTDNAFIQQVCESYKVERVIKNKHEIPHDRHWILDEQIYNVSKSIDFINVKTNGNINIEHTLFTLVDKSESEQQVQKLLGEVNE